MHQFKKLVLGGLLCLFLFSCEKKYLEIVPVVERVEDMSIPTASGIKHLSFPSQNIGYAAADTNYIYKTTDGGKNWNKLNLNISAVDSWYKCNFLEFYDDQNGICLMKSTAGQFDEFYVLITENGGATWKITAYEELAGITKTGKAYTCEYNLRYRTCLIRESVDRGKTFKNLVTLYIGDEYIKTKVSDNSVYVTTQDGGLYGYNPVTSDTLSGFIGTHSYHYDLKDFIFKDDAKAAVFEAGKINSAFYEEDNSLINSYDEHAYNYYSVDSFNNLIIAVGENTIATNMDVQDEYKWHEVFDQNGNGFSKTFYKIKFIDQNHFYVSGKNGLIWKMKI